MAKDNKRVESNQDMTIEEAKAYRASKAASKKKVLTDKERREQFRVFWAEAKTKYGQTKDLEHIVWLHLVATKTDKLEKFSQGVTSFGFKEIK